MSMSINGLGATSMLAQLQKMQQQMRTLSMASADNQMLNQNVNNTPVFNQPEVTTTSGAAPIEQTDNVLPHTDFEQTQYKIDNSLIRKIIIDKDDE